jgi:hypothetical protein
VREVTAPEEMARFTGIVHKQTVEMFTLALSSTIRQAGHTTVYPDCTWHNHITDQLSVVSIRPDEY